MAEDIVPIDEQLESVMQKHGSLENYKSYFCKLGEDQRRHELYVFNRSFNEEIARPTKDYAAHVQLRRELTGLDNLLRNSGR
jgi:hypothetical protein